MATLGSKWFAVLVIASMIVAYVFAALSVTANQILGTGLRDGPSAIYYFPLIGGRALWESWIIVFTGIGVLFFMSWFLGYATGRSHRESFLPMTGESETETKAPVPSLGPPRLGPPLPALQKKQDDSVIVLD